MGFKFNPLTGKLDLTGQASASADGTEEIFTAGETISAMKAVYRSSTTEVGVADSTVTGKERAIGVAMNAANVGEPVTVKLFGKITDAIFAAFALNDFIFLGTLGGLTATAPTVGYRTLIGLNLGSNEFLIDIQEPITL